MLGQPNKEAEGRARGAVRVRTAIFEDPTWEERFDVLIRVTQRTQLIRELTGTDVRTGRLKEAIDRRYAESGEKTKRPRGLGRQYSSQSFLYTKNERLDAAYLIALHFGGNGPGVSGEAEDNLGRALDKRLEVFLTYKTSLYPNSAEPKINFESYCMLVSGIRAGAIDVHTCPDCGTRHPWNAERLGLPICPACTVMDLRVRAGRQEIDARIRQKRAAEDKKAAKYLAEA